MNNRIFQNCAMISCQELLVWKREATFIRKNTLSEPECTRLLSVAMIKHQLKPSREAYAFSTQFILEGIWGGTQGRNLQSRTGADNGGALFTGLLPGMFASYIMQSVSTYQGLPPSTEKQNALQIRPQVTMMRHNSSAEVFSSQLSPVCVKLIKQTKE